MERNTKNRQGVDVSGIEENDHIVYQCGKGTCPKLTVVLSVPDGGYRAGDAIRTSAGTIAFDYVLAIVPTYKPPPPKPIDMEWYISDPNCGCGSTYRPIWVEPVHLHVGNDAQALQLAIRIVADHNAVVERNRRNEEAKQYMAR